MPNKYLDSVGLAEYTSLIKAELAPKNSPALTGTPTAPTPTAGDDSTKIATTEFVQDEVANYLPLAGGTLTGNVYTTPYYDSTIVDPEGGQTLIVSKGKVAKGTAPSNNEWHTMVMAVDNSGSTNNANKYGQVETGVKTDGSVETTVQAYKNEASSTTSAKISVGYDANGNAFTSAPTPTAGDNSTKIATTAFVNTKAGNYLPLAGGTMTGNIRFNKEYPYIGGNLTDGSMSVFAGANAFDGATLQLFGRSDSTYAGRFYLRASTKSGQSDSSGSDVVLAGRPDGTLTWGGVSLTDGTFLTTRSVSVNASSGTAGYTITAPAVSGYQFICWYMSASNGNVYPTYIANSNTSSTKVWAVNPTNNTSIVCFALYVRKW